MTDHDAKKGTDANEDFNSRNRKRGSIISKRRKSREEHNERYYDEQWAVQKNADAEPKKREKARKTQRRARSATRRRGQPKRMDGQEHKKQRDGEERPQEENASEMSNAKSNNRTKN